MAKKSRSSSPSHSNSSSSAPSSSSSPSSTTTSSSLDTSPFCSPQHRGLRSSPRPTHNLGPKSTTQDSPTSSPERSRKSRLESRFKSSPRHGSPAPKRHRRDDDSPPARGRPGGEERNARHDTGEKPERPESGRCTKDGRDPGRERESQKDLCHQEDGWERGARKRGNLQRHDHERGADDRGDLQRADREGGDRERGDRERTDRHRDDWMRGPRDRDGRDRGRHEIDDLAGNRDGRGRDRSEEDKDGGRSARERRENRREAHDRGNAEKIDNSRSQLARGRSEEQDRSRSQHSKGRPEEQDNSRSQLVRSRSGEQDRSRPDRIKGRSEQMKGRSEQQDASRSQLVRGRSERQDKSRLERQHPGREGRDNGSPYGAGNESPGRGYKRNRSRSRSPEHEDPLRGGARWDVKGAEGYSPDRRGEHRPPSYRSNAPPPGGRAAGAPTQRTGYGARSPARGSDLSPLPPAVPSIHSGVVHSVKPFGVFVQLEGFQRQCLVHHSQVSADIQLSKSDEDDMKVKALEFAAPAGHRVWVKVTEVSGDGAGFKLHGSMKAVSQEDGTDLDPTGRMTQNSSNWSDDPPEVGSVHRSTVKRVEPYGVFVQLEGFRRYGLVHTSQVSNFLEFSKEDTDTEKVAGLRGVVAVNDPVWVKVVEVQEGQDGRGPRIGCSIKLVNQTDGQDLDPHSLRYKPRAPGDGPGGPPGGRGARIGGDAGAVVQGGVINWGYTRASDARVAGAGRGEYALLEEDAELAVAGGATVQGSEQQDGPPLVLAPAGRGRGSVLPAWMTGSGTGAMKPGGDHGELPPPPGFGPTAPVINSVEEALAILQKYGRGGNKKKKDKKKSSKGKDGKKAKKAKDGKKDKKSKKHKYKEKEHDGARVKKSKS